jgi:MoxR-like ATPase
MAERQVTIDGVTRRLSEPFLLLAKENPIEQEGTFPLPEAQLDRFFLKTDLGYPTVEQEMEIVREQRDHHPLDDLRPVVTVEDIVRLQDAIEDVYTDELILRWIVELVQASREVEPVALGASVRASLALERTARAWALLHNREYVKPDDVETLFLPVLGHRIIFTPTFLAEARRLGRDNALAVFRDLCLSRVARPEPSADYELKVLGTYDA